MEIPFAIALRVLLQSRCPFSIEEDSPFFKLFSQIPHEDLDCLPFYLTIFLCGGLYFQIAGGGFGRNHGRRIFSQAFM
jgi:hypothetical protein